MNRRPLEEFNSNPWTIVPMSSVIQRNMHTSNLGWSATKGPVRWLSKATDLTHDS